MVGIVEIRNFHPVIPYHDWQMHALESILHPPFTPQTKTKRNNNLEQPLDGRPATTATTLELTVFDSNQ